MDCGTVLDLTIDHVNGRDYDLRKMDPSWRIAVYEREEREGVELAVRCNAHNVSARWERSRR